MKSYSTFNIVHVNSVPFILSISAGHKEKEAMQVVVNVISVIISIFTVTSGVSLSAVLLQSAIIDDELDRSEIVNTEGRQRTDDALWIIS